MLHVGSLIVDVLFLRVFAASPGLKTRPPQHAREPGPHHTCGAGVFRRR